jgi:hypothetical protein
MDGSIFTVFLHGKNLWILLEGEKRRMGFYTTRFVTSDSPDGAKIVALKMVEDDLRPVLLNASEDPPVILVEEVAPGGPTAREGRGYTWYPEDTEQLPES